MVLSLTVSSLLGNTVGAEDEQLKLELITAMMGFLSIAFYQMLQWRDVNSVFKEVEGFYVDLL